jgi:hypothetical protein
MSTTTAPRCAPFWAESPAILWTEWRDFFPFSEAARKCTSVALNSFTRFGIYLGVLLALLYRSSAYFGFALGFAAVSVAAYYGMKSNNQLREGFLDGAPIGDTVVTPTLMTSNPLTPSTGLVGGSEAANRVIADVIGEETRKLPTVANPFMNALVSEVYDNPSLQVPAANIDNSEAARALSDEFQTRLYGDPTDVFQHTQDQRVWAVQPNTSIPNDQESFQNWLFRVPGRTCKEGNNAACRSGTEGGVVTWLGAA